MLNIVLVGQVSLFVGDEGGTGGNVDGVGTNVRVHDSRELALSFDDSVVVFAEEAGCRIRKVVISTLSVTTIAGGTNGYADGVGSHAQFKFPRGLDITSDGSTVFVADTNNRRIRQIDVYTGNVTTLAGSSVGSVDGVGTNVQFDSIMSLALFPDDAFAVVADYSQKVLRIIELSTANVTTFAGIKGVGGGVDGSSSVATFSMPTCIAIALSGRNVVGFVNDRPTSIRRIEISYTGGKPTATNITTIVSSGLLFAFNVATSMYGNFLLVSDMDARVVNIVDVSGGGAMTVLAGSGNDTSTNGIGTMASFYQPFGSVVSHDGTFALVSELGTNNKIRKIILSIPPTSSPTG